MAHSKPHYERIQKLIAEAPPLDETSFPTAVNTDGWPVDPTTVIHIKAPNPGDVLSLDSIFGVPPGPNDRIHNVTVQEVLEMMYAADFRGRAVFDLKGPHPQAKPQGERISQAQLYPPTECKICTAIIAGDEKRYGYTMLELRHAGLFGCSTCSALYQGIKHFADMVHRDHEDWETKVEQKTIGESKLLAQSIGIHVRFEEDAKFFGNLDLTCEGRKLSCLTDAPSAGRVLDTSSFATIVIVKDWLQTCMKNHDSCTIPSRTALPSRLLEVANHRVKLCETFGQTGTYFALSHSWGLNAVAKTEKANIEARKRDIPWMSLSKTFQDAILLTWKLGYRYLWIDSLCIIQDDKKDWEIQASRMSQIFSNAQLTISASRAADGMDGCFSRRSEESFQFPGRGRLTEQQNPRIWEPCVTQGRDRDGIDKEFRVEVKIPHGLSSAPLLTRAWVFQEQILSPRILHFAPAELYWECKSHVACECTGWEKRTDTLQFETRKRKAHNQLVGYSAHLHQSSIMSRKLQARNFEAYRTLVEQYTEMQITYDSDRLPALSGIAFGRQDEYLAGIWRSMLVESLHWATKAHSSNPKLAYRPSRYRAPSWSWASVESPIRHVDEFSTSYQDEDVEIIANVIAVSCHPEGSDPRGKVASGYLRLDGPVINVRVDGLGIYEDPRNKGDTYAIIRRGRLEDKCDLDVPLVLGRTTPAEVKHGDELLCIRLSTNAALVLKDILGTPGAYERVGIFKMESKMSDRWFSHANSEAVFIL